MTIVYHTPAELIAALRTTAASMQTQLETKSSDLMIVYQLIGSCMEGMRQAANMLERTGKQTDATTTAVITRTAPGDLSGAHAAPKIEVTDQLAQRLADRFWAIIEKQKDGTGVFASILARGNHAGGWIYFKQALTQALTDEPSQWSEG
jgi:hypothetical protein